LEGIALKDKFSRLFELSDNKMAEMKLLGWDEGGEAWKWHKRLWEWEQSS